MTSELFEQAKRYIPGGVNSPVRAFGAVGGTPLFMKRASGSRLFTEDGRELIDYVGSWGPAILGHAHPDVIRAVQATAADGLSFGAPCAAETDLARRVCELVPSVERVRFCSSGTEATMSAIRLARGFTGRDLIVKFEGCYHGHSDSLLVKAGSGALTFGVPTSPGVPADLAKYTLTLPFNDTDALEACFEQHGDRIACIIVEPIAGNMNFVPGTHEFIHGMREACDAHGSVLIFDEVMSGFRVALGGAQAVYDVRPDLTTFGKVIGGGMPVGAFGGRRDVMETVSPTGPVYQAGTLSGNPVAMAAGIATLERVAEHGFHERLQASTDRLVSGLRAVASACRIPMYADHAGGMFGFFFTEESPVRRFEQVTACDIQRFKGFFHGMLDAGVYLAPSAYEAGFVSSAHSDRDIEVTLEAAERVLSGLG